MSASSSSLTPSKKPNSISPQAPSNRFEGLSKFHQSILSRTCERQRFVTGRYPLVVTVTENPTRRWLGLGRSEDFAETEILVNGTSPLKSLASFDRFQWLDDDEREELVERYRMLSLELLAEVHIDSPGYLHILPRDSAGSSAALLRDKTSWNRWRQAHETFQSLQDEPNLQHRDRLWVSGFSLAGRRGLLKSIDCECGTIESVNDRTSQSLLWPNEVVPVPQDLFSTNEDSGGTWQTSSRYQDALLVCDGFLVPGKDRGALYLVKNPGNPHKEWTVSLTGDASGSSNDRWFYHKASWVDLTGDGRMSILTARCKVSTVLGKKNDGVTSGITQTGQLVWLEMPKAAEFDPETGTPLESDGTEFDPFSSRHLPWKVHVLAEGPDVMFCVADLDCDDNSIEVISSQFFAKKVVLHSIERGQRPYVSFSRVIDDQCGAAFGCTLVNFDGIATAGRKTVDSGSTVSSFTQPSSSFSHLLISSHECTYENKREKTVDECNVSVLGGESVDGGSLFAYRIPVGKDAWRTEPFIRSTLATGFKVNGQLKNMINPGAPGFVYAFHASKSDAASGKRPLIAVAGDCAESAYLFRPCSEVSGSNESDEATRYKLMVEIKCGATVGSIGVGYDLFTSADQEEEYAKLYIPCYEKDKIIVFALGSGEEDVGGW